VAFSRFVHCSILKASSPPFKPSVFGSAFRFRAPVLPSSVDHMAAAPRFHYSGIPPTNPASSQPPPNLPPRFLPNFVDSNLPGNSRKPSPSLAFGSVPMNHAQVLTPTYKTLSQVATVPARSPLYPPGMMVYNPTASMVQNPQKSVLHWPPNLDGPPFASLSVSIFGWSGIPDIKLQIRKSGLLCDAYLPPIEKLR